MHAACAAASDAQRFARAAIADEEEEEGLGGVALRHRVARLATGIRLHFVEAGPADDDAPLVLLLHGFPDTHLSARARLARASPPA